MGYSPQGHEESDMTERLSLHRPERWSEEVLRAHEEKGSLMALRTELQNHHRCSLENTVDQSENSSFFYWKGFCRIHYMEKHRDLMSPESTGVVWVL